MPLFHTTTKTRQSNCSRILQTLVAVISTLLAFTVVVKISTPSKEHQILFDNLLRPSVIDIISLNSGEECKPPHFLVFEYRFKGMALGCVCNNRIVHSGYCTLAEVSAGCIEKQPIQAQSFQTYNSLVYLCAKVGQLKSCDSCPTGLCSKVDSDPCPIVNIQQADFPPSNSYFKLMDLTFAGKTLYASRSDGTSPLSQTITNKGTTVCMDSSVQNTDNFTNRIYQTVTLQQQRCQYGNDKLFTKLTSIPDYLLYASNNVSLQSESNNFTTFVKGRAPVARNSSQHSLVLGGHGLNFWVVSVLLSIGYTITTVIQQLILHKYQAASSLLFVVYISQIIISAFAYTKLSDFLTLCSNVSFLDDQTNAQISNLIDSVQTCCKVMLVGFVLSSLLTLAKGVILAIEFRVVCRRISQRGPQSN